MPDDTLSGPQVQPNEPDPEVPPSAPRVVGIGASAGGIEALRQLFPQVEPGSGMAFVVVQHLDPHHTSILPELIARCTTLPVEAVEDETVVLADHVYVIPPNKSLTVQNGRLRLERPAAPRGQRNPIDEFMISLATDRGENAACVILSGTGSDGTLGLRAIKEHGGVILAQAGAEYDGMMRSAVATGLVDFVLPAEEIAVKLADYFGRIARAQERRPEVAQPVLADHLARIAGILRERTGHDFSNYKDRTVVRRILRRMHVLQIDDMGEFARRLAKDSREVMLLFQDLLIGVTNFFRDPAAFAALERTALPELFKDKGPNDTIRVWVPGCATGEEAYSIAILLRDCAPDPHRAPKLQVFASDIDEQALNIARVGRYPASIAKDVPAPRLARYFSREDGTYRVVNELREICLFSAHNLLRDAPFSKLHLIACRNLLIYLQSGLQDRLIPLFHYALVPDGVLFLGSSENVSRHSRLFVPIDKHHRIFRRRGPLERRIPEFPLLAPDLPRRTWRSPPAPKAAQPSLREAAERQLLDRFLPAYVVVNADGDVLQTSGRTGDYLELPAGAPDTNIFNMARPALRLELRAAFHRAASSKQPTLRHKLVLPTTGGRKEIDLVIQPLRFDAASEPLYMILFQDRGATAAEADAHPQASEDETEASVRHLEAELHHTKERLQATTEELESSNEELRSGNEELQSVNEELQSANEELETSKEELQSINEELQTVNAELSARVEELSRANNDMSNLLESTQIATVFLDRGLLVKGFTPAAKEVFRLVESDTGRPIMHVRSRLDSDTIQEDAEHVLRTLASIERPVRSIDSDARYMMRMLPYRTVDNVIGGVVMTFTDITRISAAEARIEVLTGDLRARIGELETILDLIPVGVMIVQNSRPQEVLANTCGAQLLGAAQHYKGLKPASRQVRLFAGGDEVPPERQPLGRASRGETVSGWQGELLSGQGTSVPVMISASPLRGEDGEVRGAVAAVVDISQHKEAEAQQHFLMSELQHRVKNILATVSSLAARMLREGDQSVDFRGAFLARLAAMGRTHDLLSHGGWSGAALSKIAATALAPYATAGSNNIRLDGPDIKMSANAAATLGMVFHELATNASKYGALSKASGNVDVSWRVLADGADERLELTWIEHGGPRPDISHPSGFGTSFITRGVEYELAGTAKLELSPEGIRCIISFPLARNVASAS